MAGHPQQLTSAKGGISRLRIKGGADKEALYDLVNGYVTQANTVESRPGTRTHAVLPSGTKGLCVFESQFHVFSDSAKTMPEGYVCEILTHPTMTGLTLARIHFAKPFMGYLYVAAEWSNGDVFHYWLQTATEWQANTFYRVGDLVAPSVENGYFYRANRLGPPGIAWAPNVARAIGDVVEPTTYNGYEFTVIETYGATPRSGATEPDWPEADGAVIVEDTDGAAPTTPTPPSDPDEDDDLPPGIRDRYGLGGNSPPTQAQ